MTDESWLSATHRVADTELYPALEAAGLRRRKDRWSRPRVGGGEDSLVLQWSRYERHDADCARFSCTGDERARTYVMVSDYALGTDESQIAAFGNSGHDFLAELVLAPLGLLDVYRRRVDDVIASTSTRPYSLGSPMPTDAATIDKITRRVRFNHRYRWSDPDGLRSVLRDDTRALLLVWELASSSPNDRYLRRRIADAFDERGFYRAWVA